jgi:hypothetical protein
MATERDGIASTTIQPTGIAQDVASQGDMAVAGEQARAASASGEQFGQMGQIATGIMRDQALRQAQEDAAQVVKRNPDGSVVPAKSGDLFKFGGLAYMEAYNKAATGNYLSAQIEDAKNAASRLTAASPNDPAAVAKGMGDYVKATVDAAHPDLAGPLQAQLEAVQAGAVTFATATKHRDDLNTMRADAERNVAAYVSDFGKALAGSSGKGVNPADREATLKLFGDRWAQLEPQLKLSGYSDVAIADIKATAHALGEAEVFGRDLMARAQTSAFDTVGRARLSAEAEKWASDPSRSKYSKQTLTVLESYINRGAVMAGAVESADQLAGQNKVAAASSQFTKNQIAFDNGEISKETLAERNNALAKQVVQDAIGLRPVQQAQLIAASRGGIAGISQAYGAALTVAQTNAVFGATPEIRAQGLADVRTYLSDPHIIRDAQINPATASLYASASRTVAVAQQEATAYDAGQTHASIVSGKVSPAEMAPHIETLRRAGVSAPAIVAAVSAGAIAWDKSKGVDFNYGNVVGKLAGSKSYIPTENEAKAIEAKKPAAELFTAVDATGNRRQVPADLSNPNHVQAALDDIGVHRFVRPAIKEMVSQVPVNASPAQQQAVIQLRDGMTSIYQKVFAGAGPANKFNANVQAEMTHQLGSENLKKIDAFIAGHGAAPAADVAKAMAIGTAGREAPLADKDPHSITSILTGTVADAAENHGSFVNGAFKVGFRGAMALGIFSPAYAQTFSTFRNDEMRRALGPMFEKAEAEFPDFDPSRVQIQAAAAQHAVDYASGPGGFLETDGEAQRAKGFDPREQAVRSWAKTHNDDLGFERVVDAATGKPNFVLTYKPFQSEFNKVLPGLSRQATNDLVASRMQQMDPSLYSQVDPATISVVTTGRNGDRTMTYSAVGRSKDGSTAITLGNVDPADPAFEHERIRLIGAVSREMKDNNVGKILSWMWGGNLLASKVVQWKEEELLGLSSGRTLPSAEWAHTVDKLEHYYTALALGPFAHIELARRVGTRYATPDNFTPEDFDAMRTERAQRSIARYGSLHYMLFGNSGTEYLAFRTPEQIDLNRNQRQPALADQADMQGADDASQAIEAAKARAAVAPKGKK